MKIVVTGHKGYVGSSLFHWLNVNGFRPVGFDIVDGPTGDITKEWVRNKIAELEPDIIYNLAGVSGEAACKANPELCQVVNYEASRELSRTVKASTIFIQASSASVLHNKGPEETPYAYWKLAAEDIYSVNAYVLRFGTVLGFNDFGPTRWDTPANAMARSAVRDRKIVVNGPALMRPWISLEALVHHLTRYASCPPRNRWDGPIPLAQENWSLGEMARTIALYKHGCEKIFSPPGEDARDYTMPALIGGGVTWAIRKLVEHA